MKELDLGEPTSFPDHVYLECNQRECETSKDIVKNYRNMFESRISAGAKKYLVPGFPTQTSHHGRKKQTSVSHSSTESEVISLDAGLRMGGIPALDLWDWLLKCCFLLPTKEIQRECAGKVAA